MSSRGFFTRLLGTSEPGTSAEISSNSPRTGDIPSPLVIVGLDFGTSSSKVVFREIMRKGRPAQAIDFEVSAETGYSRFCFPSSVALSGNRLSYGEAAEREVKVYRSFKIRLLPGKGRKLPSLHPEATPDPNNPAFIASIYLAVVLARARSVIAEAVINPRLLYNMDVPVSALEHSGACDIFYRVLTSAIALSENTEPLHADLASAWAAWRSAWAEGGNPGFGAPATLIEETRALASGAGNVLSADENMYKLIVDIGAGTTDVACFKILRREAEDRLPIFASGTEIIGCDDLDRSLAERVKASLTSDGQLRGRIRRLKSQIIQSGEVELRIRLGLEELDQSSRQLSKRIFDHYSKIFGEAYRKEQDQVRWRNIEVVVAGGGSRIASLRACFRRPPRDFVKSVSLVDLLFPRDLLTAGHSVESPTEHDLVFLLPAIGLSFPEVELPKPKLPSRIEDFRPQEKKGPTGIYDYEVDGYV